MSARDTALAESAQAIFCSLSDYLGSAKSPSILNITKYKTFTDFIDQKSNIKLLNIALKRVTIDVKVEDVYEYIIKNPKWYVSSVLIANKLVKDLGKIDKDFDISQKGYSDGKMFYLRGDEEVMNLIAKLFKIANTSDITKLLLQDLSVINFTDINKWSPADIYFANPTAKTELANELKFAKSKPKKYSFLKLNNRIRLLIDGGNLLPLSLKKTTSTVKLEKVNFSLDKKTKLLSAIKFIGTSDWQPYKKLGDTPRKSWNQFKKGNRTTARALRLKITMSDGVKGEIGLRHDPSGGTGRFVLEFIGGGAEARGGSIGSTKLFHRIWSTIDPIAANSFLKKYDKANPKFKDIKNQYQKNKARLREDKIGNVSEYDHYMAIASAEQITNKIMPDLKRYFRNKSNKGNTEDLIRLLFQYVTSRDPKSSRFIIAK